jgi:hypothetical protein
MNTLRSLVLWLLVLCGPLALGLGAIEFIRADVHAPAVGGFNVTGGGTYRLYSSIGTSQTSITLSSFKEPISSIPYTMTYLKSDVEYGTIDPNSNSISEFVSFTGITQNTNGTATLTGVTRGLLRTPGAAGACTASTTLAQAHSGQAIFILSNSPCFQGEYIPLRQTATSSATLVFASTTPPRFDADPGATAYNGFPTSVFVDQAQLARTALAGTVNATAILNGVVQLATGLQAASSTVTGSSGANDVLWAKYATDTPNTLTRGTVIPMTTIQGFLAQSWLDFTQLFTFTGGFLSTASSTIGNGTQASGLTINGGATSTKIFLAAAGLAVGTASTTLGAGNLVASATTTLNGCNGCYERLRAGDEHRRGTDGGKQRRISNGDVLQR